VAKSLAHLRPAAGVSFVSQVGADDAGAAYRQGLADAGVRPLLLESRTGLPSSTCLCLARASCPPHCLVLFARPRDRRRSIADMIWTNRLIVALKIFRCNCWLIGSCYDFRNHLPRQYMRGCR